MLHGDYVAIESNESQKTTKQNNVAVETNDGLVINDTNQKLKNQPTALTKSSDQPSTTKETKKTRFVVKKQNNKNVVDNSGTEKVVLTRADKESDAIIVADSHRASVEQIDGNNIQEKKLDVIISQTQ